MLLRRLSIVLATAAAATCPPAPAGAASDGAGARDWTA